MLWQSQDKVDEQQERGDKESDGHSEWEARRRVLDRTLVVELDADRRDKTEDDDQEYLKKTQITQN